MNCSNKLKGRLFSGAVLVLSAMALSGCGFFSSGHMWGDIAGDVRTLPDEDQVDFGNRHSPILNPGTNMSYTPATNNAMGRPHN